MFLCNPTYYHCGLVSRHRWFNTQEIWRGGCASNGCRDRLRDLWQLRGGIVFPEAAEEEVEFLLVEQGQVIIQQRKVTLQETAAIRQVKRGSRKRGEWQRGGELGWEWEFIYLKVSICLVKILIAVQSLKYSVWKISHTLALHTNMTVIWSSIGIQVILLCGKFLIGWNVEWKSAGSAELPCLPNLQWSVVPFFHQRTSGVIWMYVH